MTLIRHGLSIGIERVDNNIFLSMKAIGKLTHEDYQVITPMIDSALEGVDSPQVNVFLDASELDGWELRAAWDDYKFGMKHKKDFSKIAIVGNKKWLEITAKIGSWFMSGEIKFFESSDDAMQWLLNP